MRNSNLILATAFIIFGSLLILCAYYLLTDVTTIIPTVLYVIGGLCAAEGVALLFGLESVFMRLGMHEGFRKLLNRENDSKG